jgi:predicted transcriptional regulator
VTSDLPLFASREAHKQIKPHVTMLQHRVMLALVDYGPSTQHRLCALFRGELAESTVRTRVSELVKKGLVEASHTIKLPNGRPATVWRIK